MEKDKALRIGIILALLVVVMVFANSILSKSSATDNDSLQNQDMEAFISAQTDGFALDMKLDGNTPIGNLYANITYSKAMGIDEDAAVKQAKEQSIEDQAFLWYAEKESFPVSKSDVEAYMSRIIADAKKADNYPAFSAACEKAGLTYEEFVRKNAGVYKVALIKDHFYLAEAEKFNKTDSSPSNEEFNAHWKSYKADVVEQFKKTSDYLSVEKVITNCIKQIKSDKLNVNQLQSEDVFFE